MKLLKRSEHDDSYHTAPEDTSMEEQKDKETAEKTDKKDK